MPQELYAVSYRVGDGANAYMDRQTATREELLDYIDNPHYHDLTITKL
jgi:hypothetical protein